MRGLRSLFAFFLFVSSTCSAVADETLRRNGSVHHIIPDSVLPRAELYDLKALANDGMGVVPVRMLYLQSILSELEGENKSPSTEDQVSSNEDGFRHQTSGAGVGKYIGQVISASLTGHQKDPITAMCNSLTLESNSGASNDYLTPEIVKGGLDRWVSNLNATKTATGLSSGFCSSFSNSQDYFRLSKKSYQQLNQNFWKLLWLGVRSAGVEEKQAVQFIGDLSHHVALAERVGIPEALAAIQGNMLKNTAWMAWHIGEGKAHELFPSITAVVNLAFTTHIIHVGSGLRCDDKVYGITACANAVAVSMTAEVTDQLSRLHDLAANLPKAASESNKKVAVVVNAFRGWLLAAERYPPSAQAAKLKTLQDAADYVYKEMSTLDKILDPPTKQRVAHITETHHRTITVPTTTTMTHTSYIWATQTTHETRTRLVRETQTISTTRELTATTTAFHIETVTSIKPTEIPIYVTRTHETTITAIACLGQLPNQPAYTPVSPNPPSPHSREVLPHSVAPDSTFGPFRSFYQPNGDPWAICRITGTQHFECYGRAKTNPVRYAQIEATRFSRCALQDPRCFDKGNAASTHMVDFDDTQGDVGVSCASPSANGEIKCWGTIEKAAVWYRQIDEEGLYRCWDHPGECPVL